MCKIFSGLEKMNEEQLLVLFQETQNPKTVGPTKCTKGVGSCETPFCRVRWMPEAYTA